MRLVKNLIPYGDAAFRRNFKLHLGNGAFSAFAESFTNSNVVMTSFASQLTSSNVLVALMVLTMDAGWFLPQFFIAPWVERVRHKAAIYRGTTVLRFVAWSVLVALVWFSTDKASLLLPFFACICFISLSSGVAGLPWTLVTAKIIPASKRGYLFGMRQFLGSLLGLVGGGVLAYILSGQLGLVFPQNYGLIFGIAGASFMISYVMFGFVTEPPDPPVTAPISLGVQLQRARKTLVTNSRYRIFLLLRSLLFIGGASAPFVTVYARRARGAGDSYFGLIAIVSVVVGLIANLAWGRLSERHGNRFVLGAAGVCGAAAGLSLLGLIAAQVPDGVAQAAMILPFVLSTLATTGIGVVGSPMLMDIAPADDRVHYFGLTNTLLGVVLLSTSGVGLIADAFGFGALFGVCAASFLGAIACVRLLRRADKLENHD